MLRFFAKNRNKRVIRPLKRGDTTHKIKVEATPRPNAEQPQPVETKIKPQEEPKMENLEKLQAIVGEEVKVPKRRVKKEKKDKGLIERTEESVIVLNEDNKMLLND